MKLPLLVAEFQDHESVEPMGSSYNSILAGPVPVIIIDTFIVVVMLALSMVVK